MGALGALEPERQQGIAPAASAADTATASAAQAKTLRVATYDTDLARLGPGLMLRDILRDDPQVLAVAQVIAHIAPDVLLLQSVDYDAGLHGLTALRDQISRAGHHFDHVFALRPNSGMFTGLDMNGDGRTGQPQDAQGYGRFAGHGGMAILSRFAVMGESVKDFSPLLWKDLPLARLPRLGGKPFPSEAAQQVQRLSSVGHWVVPVALPAGEVLHLLAFHATPPVFDGAEDRNGLRNGDEIRLWVRYLEAALPGGAKGSPPVRERFVILGNANLDPNSGEGDHTAIRQLLRHPLVQDVRPAGASALDPLHTVQWHSAAIAPMRVSYVLPSRDLAVKRAGVFWPAPGSAEGRLLAHEGTRASRHHLVWVDVVF